MGGICWKKRWTVWMRRVMRDFEVVVVDDGSDDDTVAWMRSTRPADRVLELASQGGLAGALNQGIAAARGTFSSRCSITTPCRNRDGWRPLDRAFTTTPEASFLASRILLYDDPSRLHAAGDHVSAATGCRAIAGFWQPDGPSFREPCEGLWRLRGPRRPYRRELFDRHRRL